MLMTRDPITVPDSGRAQRLQVVAGGCSVQGARRETNEDAQYVSPSRDLFIVADGVGGHAAGEVASRFAVEVLSHDLASFTGDASEQAVKQRMREALDRANCLILEMASGEPGHRGAETTVVLALLLNHRLYVTGVGDSRAYLIRDRSIKRLTIDDTWPDALLHLGQISADAAKQHFLRNNLLAALGMRDYRADKEEVFVVDAYFGDRYLLATDGLTDAVDEQRLGEIVTRNDDPQQAAEALAHEAISCGAGDDVTCVAFFVRSESNGQRRVASTWRQRLKSLLRKCPR